MPSEQVQVKRIPVGRVCEFLSVLKWLIVVRQCGKLVTIHPYAGFQPVFAEKQPVVILHQCQKRNESDRYNLNQKVGATVITNIIFR